MTADQAAAIRAASEQAWSERTGIDLVTDSEQAERRATAKAEARSGALVSRMFERLIVRGRGEVTG